MENVNKQRRILIIPLSNLNMVSWNSNSDRNNLDKDWNNANLLFKRRSLCCRLVGSYHLPSIQNYRNFLSNGKHPLCLGRLQGLSKNLGRDDGTQSRTQISLFLTIGRGRSGYEIRRDLQLCVMFLPFINHEVKMAGYWSIIIIKFFFTLKLNAINKK